MKHILLLLVCVFLTKAHGSALIPIDPKVRPGIEGQNTGAFVTLRNPSDHPLKIVKATSPVAKICELHESSEEEGIHKMRPVEAIEIPAQGEAVLKPGGYHIMLLNLTQDLSLGDKIPVTLILKDGRTLTLACEVKKCCGCH
jgi:copper(I)-binding protein